MTIQWEQLSRIKSWTPLKELPVKAKLVMDNLYQLSESSFVLTVESPHISGHKEEDGPFITVAGICANSGVAKRSMLHILDSDDGSQLEIIPSSILNYTDGTYGSLSELSIEFGGHETGSYSRIPESKFVHKVIHVKGLEFCFRSNKDNDNEPVYAIRKRLEK